MPVLRIVSDALAKVFVDGNYMGSIESEKITSYILSKGEHFLNITNFYYSFLRIGQIVSLTNDQALEFSFSLLLNSHPKLLHNMELFRFQEGGKTGLFEPTTKTIIVPPRYDKCSLMYNSGLYVVEIKGKKGVIDCSGRLVVQCVYDDISIYQDWIVLSKDGSYKLIDKDGNIVKDAVPSKIHVYSNYNSDNLYFYYTISGKTFLSSINGKTIFCGNYDSAIYDDKTHLIWAYNGEPYIFDHRVSIYRKTPFGEPTKLVGPCLEIEYKEEEGLLIVRNYVKREWGQDLCKGVYDLYGNCVLPMEYEDILRYAPGFYVLYKGKGKTVVRYNGEVFEEYPTDIIHIISDRYLILSDHSDIVIYDIINDHREVFKCDDIDYMIGKGFNTGLYEDVDYLQITRAGKYGIISLKPFIRQICDSKYDDISKWFINGYAWVKKDNEGYGAIDTAGNEVILCQYGEPFNFTEDGLARVSNKTCDSDDIIDVRNNSLFGLKGYSIYSRYEYSSLRKDQLILAERDSKQYLFDFNRNLLGVYDSIESCENSGYIVSKTIDGIKKYGFVNGKGEEIIPCKYYNIKAAGSCLLWCAIKEKHYALFTNEGVQLTSFDYNLYYYKCKEFVFSLFFDGYAVVEKSTGVGILSSSGKEVTAFNYKSVDLFYKDHAYLDTKIYDDVDDRITADIEGIFRFGVASLEQQDNNRVFVDIHGNNLHLQELGTSLFDQQSQF